MRENRSAIAKDKGATLQQRLFGGIRWNNYSYRIVRVSPFEKSNETAKSV